LYALVTTGPTTFTFPNGNTLSSNGYQLGVGYDFNKNFATELTFGSLYKLAATGANVFDESIATTNFSVLALYPMDNFSPYVKLGVTSYDLTITNIFGTYNEKASRLVYGVGTEVKLDQRTALRLEYATTRNETGRSQADYVQVGAVVRF
jgi:hypothetical protein